MNKIVPEEKLNKIEDSFNKFKYNATRALVSGFDILQSVAVYIWSGFSRFINKNSTVLSDFPNPVSDAMESVCSVVESNSDFDEPESKTETPISDVMEGWS